MTKHRQVSRLVALENAPSIDPCLMIRFGLTAAVADQTVDNTAIPTRAPTAEAGAVSRIIAPTLLTLRTRVFEPFDAAARHESGAARGSAQLSVQVRIPGTLAADLRFQQQRVGADIAFRGSPNICQNARVRRRRDP